MSRRSGRTARTILVVAGLAGVVAGCDTLSDAIYTINPFAEKDKVLPGDRHAVFEGGSVSDQPAAVRRAASIGPQRANEDWPQPGGTASNNPGNLIAGTSGARVWSSSAAGTTSFRVSSMTGFGHAGLRIGARPVVAGGRVYVYAPGGVITALSLSGGGRAWQQTIRPEKEGDTAVGGGVAYDQGRLYAATSYGTLSALDPGSGKSLWTKDLEAPARGAPTAADGKVFVVTQTNVVLAVNQADGAELWTYRGIPETAGLLAAASPAVLGDTVVVPYTSGEVIAFNIADGQPRWAETVTSSQRTFAVSSINDVSASPVIDGGMVFATGVSGQTIAIDLKTGERRWAQEFGSPHTPIVSGNAVFMVDLDDNALALDRATGEPLWTTKLPVVNTRKERTHWAGPVLASGVLWFVSSDGKLAQVDASSGNLIATRETGEQAYMSPVIASGMLIVVSASGTISAYR